MTSNDTSTRFITVHDQKNYEKQKEKRCRFSVNKQLIPLKMFYFFFYGASGTFIPFITVYLKHLNMSASEAGLITGLSMLVAMLMRTVIGMVADKMSARKTSLLICCVGFGVAFFTMWFVPQRNLHLISSGGTNDDVPLNESLHNLEQNQQVYTWICVANNGNEICRYPRNGNSPECRIVELKDLQTENYNNSDGGNLNLKLQGWDFTSDKVHALDNDTITNTDTDSDIFPTERIKNSKSYGDQQQPPSLNFGSPCFYVVALSNTNSNLDGSQRVHSDYANLPETKKNRVVQSFDSTISPTGSSHDEFGALSSADGTVSDVISCLKNCSEQLIGSTDDDLYDVINKETSNAFQAPKRGIQSYSGDMTFLLSFLLLITGKSLYSASTSLADAVAYTILGPYSLKWGQQRLWGTVGTGATVLTIAMVTDSQQVDSFAGLFIACLGLSCLAFLVGFIKLRADKAAKNKTFFKDLTKLLNNGPVRLFLVKLLFYGVMAGTVQNFTFWFLVDIGSAQITLRICLLLYCISSIFMLRYSRLVLHKLGHAKIMYITLVAYAIRYLVLSFLTNAWLVLPAEILHGVTYSLFWAAASSTASIVATSETRATSQGLAGAVYWDFGRGVGIIITGQILQLFGARWTFRVYSLLCVGVLPLLWMCDRTWPPPTHVKVANGQEDGEVKNVLLKSGTINGVSLNNNEETPSVFEKLGQVVQDDMAKIDSEKVDCFSDSSFNNATVNGAGDFLNVESNSSNDNVRSVASDVKIILDSDIPQHRIHVNVISDFNNTNVKEDYKSNKNASKSEDSHTVLSYVY